MSDQRSKMANLINQRIMFSGTVGEFTHKKVRGGGKGPVLLLLDIDQVDKKGKTIDPDLADHVWVNANKEVFKLGKEIMPNDVIMFSAVVKTYSIVRKDVIDKRNAVVDNAARENKQIFNDYRDDYVDWKDDWQKVLEANKEAKQQLQNGLIDRKTYQQIERDNINNYKAAQPNGTKVKSKESRIVHQALAKKKSYKLVDYQLENLQDVKFLKERRVLHGWRRLNISTSDTQKIKFTKYLAARSFAYRDGVPFDVFDNK